MLDGNIEEILEMIIEGKTFRQMASHFGCSISVIHRLLYSEEHSARAKSAMQMSASSYADKAEEVLIQAEKNSIEMTRARELAQHYRWKASKRNPNNYGNKVDVTSGGDKIQPTKGIDLSNATPEELEVIAKLTGIKKED